MERCSGYPIYISDRVQTHRASQCAFWIRRTAFYPPTSQFQGSTAGHAECAEATTTTTNAATASPSRFRSSRPAAACACHGARRFWKQGRGIKRDQLQLSALWLVKRRTSILERQPCPTGLSDAIDAVRATKKKTFDGGTARTGYHIRRRWIQRRL